MCSHEWERASHYLDYSTFTDYRQTYKCSKCDMTYALRPGFIGDCISMELYNRKHNHKQWELPKGNCSGCGK